MIITFVFNSPVDCKVKPVLRTMDLSIHWGHGKREEDLGHKIICFSAMSLNLYFLFDPGCSFHFTLCKGVTGEGTKGPGSVVCANNFTI